MSKLVVFTEDEVEMFFSFLDDRRSHRVPRKELGPSIVEHFGLSKAKAEEVIEIWEEYTDRKAPAPVARRARIAWGAYQ